MTPSNLIEEIAAATQSENLKRMLPRSFRDRNIHISLPTIDSLDKLRDEVSKFFPYEPSYHMLIDAMLLTGKFTEEQIVKNIREAFTRKANPSSRRRTFYITLTPDAFRISRKWGLIASPHFRSKIDLHMLTNAMLQTGDYSIGEILESIHANFSDSEA